MMSSGQSQPDPLHVGQRDVRPSHAPLRITFVLGSYDVAGGTRVLATYAERLQRRGHDVTVVAPPPRRPGLRDRVKAWITLRSPKTWPSFFDDLSVRKLLLDRNRPVTDGDVPDADVVIATWWETAEWVANLSPSKGTKVHLIQGQEGNPLWFDSEMIVRAKAVYTLPLNRIAVSQSLVDWLEGEHGCRKVALVPNAVDFDLFHAPARDRQEVPTVGFVYHHARWKGLGVALEAFDRLEARIPEVRYVAFGWLPETPELPLRARTQYYVNPPQDQIRGLYAQCDVWVCSSVVEGFALPPLEAMACRCPVVSTRVGGLERIVVDDVSGYLVPVGDVDALTSRLQRVLTLPEASWRSMSEAAHGAATAYSWDDATARMEATLRGFIEAAASTDSPAPRPGD